MAKKFKTFLNDKDGLTIVDFATTSFTIVFLAIAIYISIFSTGEDTVKVEVLRILTQPIMVILGGYFANEGIQQLTHRDRPEESHPTETKTNYEDKI